MGRMNLKAIQAGRLDKPKRVLLYGEEGVGKSTFGAQATAPVFIAAENGTAQLDVARFPEPKTWAEVLEAVDALDSDEHQYRTVVIDTLDWLEPLCWAHVCQKYPMGLDGKTKIPPDASGIEVFGFGKGYNLAVTEWRLLLAKLDRLYDTRGMDIVFLAHAQVKTFKNPEGEDFDRYELTLQDGKNISAARLLKQWPDAVLFAKYETLTNTEKKRTRGVSTGARIVHSERRAAFDAKNRYGLPERFPLGWDDFVSLIDQPGDVDELAGRIRAMLGELAEVHATKAAAAFERAGNDPTKLAKLVDWMSAKIETTTPKTETKAA